MKLDLQENMYVRTKYGISQYKYYDTTNGKLLCIPVKDGTKGMFANVEDIIKASFNIIDILEVGDILSFYEDIDNYKKIYSVGIPDLITLDKIIDKIKNDNIRLIGILTHEQMEQISYKLGE